MRLPTLTPGDLSALILAEDEAIIAVNKPSGVSVIPDGYSSPDPCLQKLLEQRTGRLWVVHRLDKDTSGVVVFGRTASSHRDLNEQFRCRTVAKRYWAFCMGCLKEEQGVITSPLRVDGDRSHRTVVDFVNGKPARTEYRLLSQKEGYCLLEIAPTTGYTHQIRAHLSSIGLPLLGDKLYRYPPSWQGERVDPAILPSLKRTALHAHSLRFLHPETRAEVHLEAPIPEDLRDL